MIPYGCCRSNAGLARIRRFQVLPHRRELLADGQPINLGGRAFDVLMARPESAQAKLK
jgi:hypothetical protein